MSTTAMRHTVSTVSSLNTSKVDCSHYDLTLFSLPPSSARLHVCVLVLDVSRKPILSSHQLYNTTCSLLSLCPCILCRTRPRSPSVGRRFVVGDHTSCINPDNDRADKQQRPLPLPTHSVDLSGALLIRDDKFIIYRKVWNETFKAQDKRQHFDILTLSRPIQSQDCVAEMKTRVEDELEDTGE